ncbi:MAG: alpha-amylase family glycosyl hydrolase [Bacteroidales bacterium]|nr:alpha-amylase family glycosyl hydrolase [Bacteroidales bacterium]
MSFIKRLLPAACALALTVPAMQAIGWPANYEGVMLQGFYWDSYDDTKWTNLESQSDELSKYFKLIWIPNSGKASGNPNMGYMPIYWFTNHNSSFGTESQLRSMIKTFKAKGTGIIADVVINHRVGVSNWADFPTETWNGKQWHIGTDGICSTDEWGQGTGNRDTGDDFNAARDLDHTNANVQENCKAYTQCLIQDYGYAGFRYDMVKGYSGSYVGMYNTAANATYSVGEYWDGSYDAVAGWIDATGKKSAAFDFPAKYCINDAFGSNDMTKLVWRANGTTPQPAGLIHFGYAQYAVTFVDNHDTYRDGSKFNGNVVAANAFILCSPGTPCVFLRHWLDHKNEIKKLIDIRNAVGVHNCSKVTVLKSSTNCYMAEVEGTKGKLVVKIGSAQESPAGYTSSDIKASGNDYCVWSKTGGVNPDPDPDPQPVTAPSNLYLLGNIKNKSWLTNDGVKLTKNGSVFTTSGVELVGDNGAADAYFTFTTTLSTNEGDWNTVNGSDRYGASTKDEPITVGTATTVVKYAANVNASGAYSWKVANGKYDVKVDFTNMTVTLTSAGQINPDPDPEPDPDPDPETNGVVIFYNNMNSKWTTPTMHYWGGEESSWPGVAMTNVGENMWMYVAPTGTTGVLFNAGDGDATKTQDYNAVDGNVYINGQSKGFKGEHYAGEDKKVYLVGNIADNHWNIQTPIEMTRNGNVYTAKEVKIEVMPAAERAAGNAKAYFNIITAKGNSWDEDINTANRFGAGEEGADPASSNDIKFYHKDISGSASKSWAVAPGTYDIKADFANMKLTVTKSGTTNATDVIVNENAEPVYYNLQGIEVDADNLVPGIYIERRGSDTRKIMVR